MGEPEVILAGEASEQERIDAINLAHRDACGAIGTSIMKGLEVGQRLTAERVRFAEKANRHTPEDKLWSKWVADNLDFGKSQDKKYRQLYDGRDILEGHSSGPLELTINEAVKRIGKALRKKPEPEPQEPLALPSNVRCDLHHCSIVDADIDPDMFDAVITDLPYPKEDMGVYSELGAFAVHSLKPGGWLVAMVGNMYLPQIINDILASGMEWRWQMCVHHAGGGHPRMRELQVFQNWKPILLFQKPPVSGIHGWAGDYIKQLPGDQDKSLHEWQQGLGTFEKLCGIFSDDGGTVADPFLGAGTTGAAAMANGRHFWGCDIDSKAVEKSRWRLLSGQ